MGARRRLRREPAADGAAIPQAIANLGGKSDTTNKAVADLTLSVTALAPRLDAGDKRVGKLEAKQGKDIRDFRQELREPRILGREALRLARRSVLQIEHCNPLRRSLLLGQLEDAGFHLVHEETLEVAWRPSAQYWLENIRRAFPLYTPEGQFKILQRLCESIILRGDPGIEIILFVAE